MSVFDSHHGNCMTEGLNWSWTFGNWLKVYNAGFDLHLHLHLRTFIRVLA